MSDLFMRRSAEISPCTRYRYWLERQWDKALPILVVCMLNPSTADDQREDPTLLALIHFGRLWGYGGLIIVNLYGWRSSSPAEMRAAAERCDELNRRRGREATGRGIGCLTPIVSRAPMEEAGAAMPSCGTISAGIARSRPTASAHWAVPTRVPLSCPRPSGPSTMIVWTTKGTSNAEQEAQAGRDHREAA